MIHLIEQPATQKQVKEMLEIYKEFVKLAVDIREEILAGGGEFHADCESVLLEEGSQQEDIWGADWVPEKREVRFGAIINLRPRQKNLSTEIQDVKIRRKVEAVVRRLLEAK